MLFLRAAALPGFWLLCVRRVQHALSPTETRPSPVRTVNAGIRVWGSAWAGGGPVRGGGGEDSHEDEEKEEDELLRAPPLLPSEAQRVFVLHPDVRRQPGKKRRSTAEWQVAEAAALVRALPGWAVVRTLVVPSAAPGSKVVFGKGNFQDLTEKIKGCQDFTSVFLNVERMAPLTKKELETAWGLPVFDRFTIVLHIFRCNARTREARMQLALAEIPLLRSSVSGDSALQDQQGWGSRYIMGSGESPTELRARALRDRELRLRSILERLRDKRRLMRRERVRREFPVVSVVGYTNCGKTTLIQALTGEATLQPRDQPFATLDVTVHAGLLPSRLRILYMDTIGFLSQLPHSLIHAFSATLEDVAYSDVLMHVTDVSHPDAELQKATVLSTLRGLHLPPALLESALEVHSKVDLVPG
ncbi:putative GTP-binding protein 6 isoform X4 [Apodemus sylvaticus]|nr:putative GTP-binding protein 6 isoform X4 [Apodemus sylvaticus]